MFVVANVFVVANAVVVVGVCSECSVFFRGVEDGAWCFSSLLVVVVAVVGSTWLIVTPSILPR